MDRVCREFTFEEEAYFYEKEAREILARQKAGCDDSEISGIARHGMRVIAKAREVISKMETTTQNGVAEKSSDAEVVISKMETTTPKWIPVTERLPEENDYYLCCVKSFVHPGRSYVNILECSKGGFKEGSIYTDDVTHWMPLPEPPKEGE